MAEALSQSQIDELLNRAKAGSNAPVAPPEPKKEKAKVYDFSSPKKFTKDQLKSLSNMYENFSRIMSSYLTSILRSVCEVTVSQIEELRYYEFNNALPENTLVGMVSFKPEGPQYDETTIMLEFPTGLGYLIVDRLMGGSEKLYAPDRDYTEIELALLKLVIENTTKYIQEAWSNFFSLTTTLRSIETNGRMIQAYPQQDIAVIVTLEISEADYKGSANICMPAENLEAVISNFGVKYSHSVKQHDPEKELLKRDMMLGYIKQSDLTVEAVLDRCKMELSDIALLQVGDIIALNKRIDSDVEVNIEGIPWFKARLGEVNDKKALKLIDTIVK